ncbi:MAG: hypothetical protein KAG56_11475 [Sulfurovaceae bacterium]|nr:hypothetical protein [Sulfurovaceae bacterium]
MLFGIRFFFLMAFFIVGCDVSLDNEPKRPALIMANSVWVGGLDGGHWISCSKHNDNGYYCRIYLPSGSLFLYGEYCFNENKNLNMGNLTYQDFDGLFITLVGDKKLLPNGVIHFPHEEGHGKQQRYKCGISIGKEREY